MHVVEASVSIIKGKTKFGIARTGAEMSAFLRA